MCTKHILPCYLDKYGVGPTLLSEQPRHIVAQMSQGVPQSSSNSLLTQLHHVIAADLCFKSPVLPHRKCALLDLDLVANEVH